MKVRVLTLEEMKEKGVILDELRHRPLTWNFDGQMDYLFGKTVEATLWAEDLQTYTVEDVRWYLHIDELEIIEE